MRPQRGQESTFLALFFLAVLAGAGVAFGPTFSPTLADANARWLWGAIGIIAGAVLVGVSAAVEATKLSCPICRTRNLGPPGVRPDPRSPQR